MHVSRLAASDVHRYRAMMLHAYEAEPDAFTSTAEERAAEPESWWITRICDPKALSIAFGAFHDEELVGTVTLEFSAKPKTRHKAHLIGMFVRESARGLGAGKALVEAALVAAAARPDVLVVTLTVTEGNAPATRLYESCGFQPFGTEPMAIATPSGLKSKVHMWRLCGTGAVAAPVKQSLGLVSLVVPDYDEALSFYVGVLGFTLVEDSIVPEQNKRWVVISPPGATESRLLIARASSPEQTSRIGNQTGGRVGFFLYTNDFQRDYEAYESKGVPFVRPPREEPYGTVAVFRDPYGNLWDLIQPRGATR